MPVYLYICDKCHREWEALKKMKDRHLENCECGFPARNGVTLPKVHAFASYIYTNMLEKERVEFRNRAERDRYLNNRKMHIMDKKEREDLVELTHKVEDPKNRPKYKVATKKVNGRPTRVVTPEI
jgi:putative FmdB family regulatory protein